MNSYMLIFSTPLRSKECLCDTLGARPRKRALAVVPARPCDQNVQFLRLGQFLSNYKG